MDESCIYRSFYLYMYFLCICSITKYVQIYNIEIFETFADSRSHNIYIILSIKSTLIIFKLFIYLYLIA